MLVGMTVLAFKANRASEHTLEPPRPFDSRGYIYCFRILQITIWRCYIQHRY